MILKISHQRLDVECDTYPLFRFENRWRLFKDILLWPRPPRCADHNTRDEIPQADLKGVFQVSVYLNNNIPRIETKFELIVCGRVWCLLDSRCAAFHQKTQLCSSHTRGQKCRVQWISSMLSWTVMVMRWNEKYNGDKACMTPFSWPRWLQEKHGIKINSCKKIYAVLPRFFWRSALSVSYLSAGAVNQRKAIDVLHHPCPLQQ